MRRVFSFDVWLCGKCGGRMKPIGKITDKRVARRMLEHVDFPSDAPEPWPARGPPESGSSSRCFDDEPQADDAATPATLVHSIARSFATGACVSRSSRALGRTSRGCSACTGDHTSPVSRPPRPTCRDARPRANAEYRP